MLEKRITTKGRIRKGRELKKRKGKRAESFQRIVGRRAYSWQKIS